MKKRQPMKLGTTTTVDSAGEVVDVKRNAMTLLPPGLDVCQECAVDHPHTEPHNQQSLYYQYAFYATHGRWPTWTDAMAHCAPEVRDQWRAQLVKLMAKRGMTVPSDLLPEEK